MLPRVAVDTNVLVYAEGFGDDERCHAANRLMQQLAGAPVVLPVQVLGELFRVLGGKYRLPLQTVREAIDRWSSLHTVADSTWRAMQSAFDLASDPGLTIWDALIVAVAAENRCRVLLTEDLQHGFTWGGVTVVNPFRVPAHPILASLAD
jgi:predicted nucleic acid-binding protein